MPDPRKIRRSSMGPAFDKSFNELVQRVKQLEKINGANGIAITKVAGIPCIRFVGGSDKPVDICEAGATGVAAFASPITTTGRLTEASASAADNGYPIQQTNGGFWVKKDGIYQLCFKTSFRKTDTDACGVKFSWEEFGHNGTSMQGRRYGPAIDLPENRPGLPSLYQWTGSWTQKFFGEGNPLPPTGSGSSSEVRATSDASFLSETGAPVVIEHSSVMVIHADSDVRPMIYIGSTASFGSLATSSLTFQRIRMSIYRITGIDDQPALWVDTET